LSLPSLLLSSPVLRGNTSHASNSWKPSYSKESTINSYAWYFKPFQVNFHVLPFKTFKYFSFCDTVFSSWGRSGRICYLPYWIKYPSTCMLHLLVINFARELVRPL
jgi:hypothetical protein